MPISAGTLIESWVRAKTNIVGGPWGAIRHENAFGIHSTLVLAESVDRKIRLKRLTSDRVSPRIRSGDVHVFDERGRRWQFRLDDVFFLMGAETRSPRGMSAGDFNSYTQTVVDHWGPWRLWTNKFSKDTDEFQLICYPSCHSE